MRFIPTCVAHNRQPAYGAFCVDNVFAAQNVEWQLNDSLWALKRQNFIISAVNVRSTISHFDFNEKLDGNACAPLHAAIHCSGDGNSRYCIRFRKVFMQIGLSTSTGCCYTNPALPVYRVDIRGFTMLGDMHERRSLNYRHHVKSYFIIVNVWACSYYPSVSIKFDERRRRRWRWQYSNQTMSCKHDFT